MKHLNNNRGSAILIAMLVMAVLVVVALGLNSLVLSEITVQRDEVERLKAFYAAESGIEKGLLDIYENNTPGYTRPYNISEAITDVSNNVRDDKYFTDRSLISNLFSNDFADYRYQVVGQDTHVPCNFDASKDDSYLTLGVNESHTIPMHKYDREAAGDHKKAEIEDFLVEYYVEGAGLSQTAVADVLSKADVLRWKVFGINTDVNQQNRRTITGQFTDAITNYLPLNSGANTKSEPSQFATKIELISKAGGNVPGVVKNSKSAFVQAKYYQRNHAAAPFGDFYDIKTNYGIDKFIDQSQNKDKHEFNYLMLTNVLGDAVKLDSFGRFVADKNVGAARKSLSSNRKLHYRIKADDTKNSGSETLACDGYLVRSNGTFRSAKQSIDMRISLDTFLPVFDFVLYERDIKI